MADSLRHFLDFRYIRGDVPWKTHTGRSYIILSLAPRNGIAHWWLLPRGYWFILQQKLTYSIIMQGLAMSIPWAKTTLLSLQSMVSTWTQSSLQDTFLGGWQSVTFFIWRTTTRREPWEHSHPLSSALAPHSITSAFARTFAVHTLTITPVEYTCYGSWLRTTVQWFDVKHIHFV